MQPLNFFFAFIVVLALIGLATWLVRRFAANRIGSSNNRGRMPRLAVIDAAAVDSRRRLVLIRRDNVEHLLMIGGPSDIVVEPNIVRASPAREQAPPRPLSASELAAESEPMRPEPMEYIEPTPELPRQTRPAFADDLRRPAPPAPERRSEPLVGYTPDAPVRAEPTLREPPLREPALREPVQREPMPRGLPRAEPMIPRPARPEPQKAAPSVRPMDRPAAPQPNAAAAAADKNLAEMAQRLEAALRRPGAEPRGESRPSSDRMSAPPTAPDQPVNNRTPARPSGTDEPEIAAASDNGGEAPKASFKNLEDEMASLLGRPKTPT